jgi:hypothetical protein
MYGTFLAPFAVFAELELVRVLLFVLCRGVILPLAIGADQNYDFLHIFPRFKGTLKAK